MRRIRRPPPPDLFGQTVPDRGRDDDMVEVIGLIIREERADSWRVARALIGAELFLPKSKVRCRAGVFTMPRWLARDRGLL
mgnify:FL=1